MQRSTRKPRSQRYVEIKPGRHPRYRRVIPKALRVQFQGADGKVPTEFVRSLKVMSYDEAHAEYEALARGSAVVVPPVAPEWPPDFDLSYLRHLAKSGGDVAARADELERLSRTIRSNIALGVYAEGEAEAAKLDRLVRRARGEKAAPVVTLKAASDRFLTTVTAPGTRKVYAPRLADIVDALGAERDIKSITRAECRTFAHETIQRIPAHWRKKWPGLSLADAITKADAVGAPTIKHETRYGFTTLLRRFFSWAESEGLVEASPAASARTPKGKRGRRSDFTSAQLKLIFDSDPFKPDMRDREPGMFWVPLLSLFSGARRDELVMLRKEDLKSERGVMFLDFREFDGRTLKNAASVRQTPLHPGLVKMGFLDYAATIKDGWLFPDLHRVKHPGDAFGKAFAKRLDGLGIIDPQLTFHSFRHSFSTGCRDSGIEKRFADRLGGWSTGGAAEGYGSYPLSVLAREIAKLHYAIDLSHLHRG